jgi:hypothetical protein
MILMLGTVASPRTAQKSRSDMLPDGISAAVSKQDFGTPCGQLWGELN